jgi:hypothetical protein
MKKSLTFTFWTLIAIFLLLIGEFFIPAFRELFRGSELFLVPPIAFSLVGIALILSTLKERVSGALKKFLLLTGASSAGFVVFILLHNLIYGLFVYFFGSDFWERTGLGDEPLFFLLALLVCPIGFLVGVIGSIALFVKQKNRF